MSCSLDLLTPAYVESSFGKGKCVKVAVIGGGVVGTCIAVELASYGASVTLFEAGPRLGGGATSAAIGGISPLSDEFIRAKLTPIFQDIFDAFWRVIERCRDSGYPVSLVTSGMLFLALTGAEGVWLREIYSAELPPEYGARWLTQDEVAQLEPGLTSNLLGGLLLAAEPALDPLDLMNSLTAALTDHAVSIMLSTTVTKVDKSRLVRFINATETSAEQFDRVVIATGNEATLLPEFLRNKITPIKGQALQFRDVQSVSAPISHHIYAHLGSSRFPDLNTSLYLVPRRDGSIVAGVTYEKTYQNREVTASALSDISSALLALVPGSDNWAFLRGWAGERPASVDGGPIIGVDPVDPYTIYALGHYGLGVTLAPITAELVSEYAGLREPLLSTGGAYNYMSPNRFVTR